MDDILTLLNLACIKYTGQSLPSSDNGDNNWKYKICYDEYVDEPTFNPPDHPKQAVWSPNPYFNPLHLYTPSFDFGARVMRKLIVDELEFIFNYKEILMDKISKLSPYGKGLTISITPIYNSPICKITQLIPKKYKKTISYPLITAGRNEVNYHPSEILLHDRDILTKKQQQPSVQQGINKHYECKYNLFTAKDELRRNKQIVEDLFEIRMMTIGMSSCSQRVYSKTLFSDWRDLQNYHFGYWNYRGKTFYECMGELYKREEDNLQPADWIRIFSPQRIDKKELINNALIANFPS
tara:strand:+ start:715 stop:1599 length:885 start_codon:yes stop_codon:yes gene_type:complete